MTAAHRRGVWLALLGAAMLGPWTRDSDAAASSLGTGGRSWTAASCLACHRPEPDLSHPVGVRVGAHAPGLPLDAGRMTCLTCHAIESPEQHDAATARSDPRLRDADAPGGLCAACHDRAAGRSDIHAAGVARAHLTGGMGSVVAAGAGGRGAAGRVRIGPGAPPAAIAAGLDLESAACVACHDGAVMPDRGHSAAAIAMAGLGVSHPVGQPYRIDAGGALRAVEDLDERIRLFDGRVGCGSCHSLYSREPGLLVMSNVGSALCLDCHGF